MNEHEKNKIVGGTLYLVATPIGNLADISSRAIKVLSEVDFIAAEDTRNTLRMLGALGISASLISYHDHNRHEAGERICARLEAGESCALVTDAGTPAISDPGADLVALCADRGLTVTSVPGACAFVTALTLSGLDTRRFVFEGFLPVKGRERRERLEALARETRTFMLHEAPHKLRTTLSDMLTAFGEERQIALCRELTKLNEEVCRTTLLGAVKLYEEREPRGEYVLIVAGADKTVPKINYPADPVLHVEELVQSGMSKKDAIKAAAKARGIAKNEIYALVMKKEEE